MVFLPMDLRSGCQHPADKTPPSPDHVEVGTRAEIHDHRVFVRSQILFCAEQVTEPVCAHGVGNIEFYAHIRQGGSRDLEGRDPKMPPQRQRVILAHGRRNAAQNRRTRPCHARTPQPRQIEQAAKLQRQIIGQHVTVGANPPGMREIQARVGQAQHGAGVADIHDQQGKS
jgi:hypothetical protein